MAKLSSKKIVDLVSELQWGNHEFFDPKEKNFDSVFYEDRNHFIYALLVNGDILQYASEEFKNDKELVEMAVRSKCTAFEFASEDIKSDKGFILELIGLESNIISFLPEKILLDKDFLSQLKVDTLTELLEHGPEELKNDKEFVLKLIGHCGYSLEYLSEDFKNDFDIVYAAVTHNGQAYQFASENLKSNKEIILAAVSESGAVLEDMSDEIRSDREIVKKAVSNFGGALEDASDDLKADKEIVLLAIGSRFNVEYAIRAISKSNDLLSDKDFVAQLLYLDAEVWDYLDASLKKDADLKLLYKIKTI